MNYRYFDATRYIETITQNSNVAGAYGFKFHRISGIAAAEELVANMRKETAFIAIDETGESSIELKDYGPFEHKLYTVFILRRFKVNDQESRLRELNICRLMMLKFLAWFLHDKDKFLDAMIYLDTDVQARELGETVLNGCTGLYFTFSFARPTDLIFEAQDWIDPNRPFDDSFDYTFGKP